jgi:sec-independent protein translocase protein TatA
MFEGLLQPMHLVLILGIVLIFFGPKRLPELGKGLGQSIRGFKEGLAKLQEEQQQAQQSEPVAEKAALRIAE